VLRAAAAEGAADSKDGAPLPARCGRLREAFAVYEDMVASGVQPDHIAFCAVIGVCAKLGDWKNALKVYAEVRVRRPGRLHLSVLRVR
jgi:pentatricopeptide repeat protein